jgi:hypothetical protein
MTNQDNNATNIDSQLMKRASRMHEAGLSIIEIARQLGTDENRVKGVLRLLGYTLAD